MSFATQITSKDDGTMWVEPVNKKHSFPEVTEFEMVGNNLYGFAGTEPSNMVSFDFGHYHRPMQVVSFSTKKLIIKPVL